MQPPRINALALMGSICIAGYLVGTLGAPLWMNRANWRAITVVSAVAAAASFAASSQVDSPTALYAVCAAIGFSSSTMTCLGMRILSDLPNKVRAFGVRQGVELSVTAAVLFALPPLAIAHWRYPGRRSRWRWSWRCWACRRCGCPRVR